MIVLAYLLIATAVYLYVRYEWREYKAYKLRMLVAEQQRVTQLRSFAKALTDVSPGSLMDRDRDRLFTPPKRSDVIAEDLLDRYDALEGPVVATHSIYTADGPIAWPFVATIHRARCGPELRVIRASSLPVILPSDLRDRHLYCIGKSGMGKSTLLRNLILQDAAAGEGIGVIAPEQEMLTDELLPFVPASRIDDVIYINPADTERPVPINPLHVDSREDFDLKLDQTLTIFHRLIDDGTTGAPRMESILRYAFAALMAIPGSTLLDVPRLLSRTDDAFRARIVAQTRDEDVRHFWQSTYPAYPKDAHLSLTNRLGRFLQPKIIRSILCQPDQSLNVRRAMDEGKILLFNVSDGILGELNAQLLGQLIVAKIQLAAMSRADTPPHARRRFHLVVDEFQAFCGVAGASYERILSRARKYNLALTLAHQQCGQIPESVMREILGNVSSLVIFRVGSTDARRLGHELEGVSRQFDHRWLTTLGQYQAYCRFDQHLLSVSTLPPPKGGSSAVRDAIIRRSRAQYGVASETRSSAAAIIPADALAIGDVF